MQQQLKPKLTFITVSLTMFLLICTPVSFAMEDNKSPPTKTLLTAKERLGNKAADNQRVNNCKVPPERRGAKPRPDACNANAIHPMTARNQSNSDRY